MCEVVDFKLLMELRIEVAKKSVVEKLNKLGGTVRYVTDSLCAKEFDPMSASKTENYASQLLDPSLLVDIGCLKAYVTIYKEVIEGTVQIDVDGGE